MSRSYPLLRGAYRMVAQWVARVAERQVWRDERSSLGVVSRLSQK